MAKNDTVKKQITFIYMDSVERAIFLPLAEEAEKRGYNVKLTDNKFEKCEIGFYCQHRNFPQFSKFSVVMLHDIVQQYSNWPDIWFLEPWNKYDVGILPSNRWVENWKQCSEKFYAVPKAGMYKIGWPKADKIASIDPTNYKHEFFQKYNLDPEKRTVLYAPAWENDGKQDDFVQALTKLNVNILIKQYPADNRLFPEMAKEIERMRLLHKDNPRVTILNPQMNIFEVIAVSDILVSDESSTMCEAIMMGVPSISVSNWLIPDVVPSRYPACDYDFVEMTLKENLTECVKNIIDHYDMYKEKALTFSKNNFSNIGKSSKMIMDIIDSYVEGRECPYSKLMPKNKVRLSIKKYLLFKYECTKREIYYNFCERIPALMILWKTLRKCKSLVSRS